MRDKNKVVVAGIIVSDYEFCELHKSRVYKTTVEVPRISGVKDLINVVIPERLIEMPWNDKGEKITILGEYRSRNFDGHLELYLFATAIEYGIFEWQNEIEVEGYICKPVSYRKTPLGREITDVLVAVNRNNCKSSYLPCIVWGRNAEWAKDNLNVGDKVECFGRIQSKVYINKQGETKTAYEVSVSRIVKWRDDNNESKN